MPSLISGFEYDIFISYRQKDNKYDGWVTEFVAHLKKELEATFKEDVFIYFDENPHDGLLEMHHVDKSLEGKLKCLIFIPIISQTYCDPKSFAWQQEFCVFNRLAKEDQWGRDIKLNNGNVTSRILPVRIHDLDAHDLALLAGELGGPLRSIDFVYREAGVNRPLRLLEETPSRNLNKTLYRNQINKVANTIKEIVQSLSNTKAENQPSIESRKRAPENVGKRNRIVAGLFLLVMFAGYFLYSTINKVNDENELFDKSIAVLPFTDMTPQKDMEYLGDGLAEEIINSLTTIRELKVIGRTSSFQFKGEQLDLREIGEKLQVGIILEGSIQKYEDHFRITAQLVRTKDNFHIWSERYDLEQTNIFKIQDNIATNIVDKLRLTLTSMEKKRIVKKEIDQETYNLYLQGLYLYKAEKFNECIPFLSKVIERDATYAPAYAYIGLSKAWITYRANRWQDTEAINDALFYSQRSIELDPDLAEGYSSIGFISWALQNDFSKARIYFEKSVEANPGASLILNRYGYFLTWMGNFEKASEFALDAMKVDPVDINSYIILFNICINSGQLDEAARYLNERERIFGQDRPFISQIIRLSFEQGAYDNVIAKCDSLMDAGKSFDTKELYCLAASYDKLKRTRDADRMLEQLKEEVDNNSLNACYNTALLYAARHEIDSCFAFLQRSIQRHETGFNTFKIEPALKELRKDPRYIKLYQENGFDKY